MYREKKKRKVKSQTVSKDMKEGVDDEREKSRGKRNSKNKTEETIREMSERLT